MRALFDPTLLFITDAEWADTSKRDEFLRFLLDHLVAIEIYNNVILWTETYENFLWSSPPILPWRMDRGWNNALIPIAYKKIGGNREYIKSGVCEAVLNPGIRKRCHRSDIHAEFLRMIHKMVEDTTPFVVCMSCENMDSVSNMEAVCQQHQLQQRLQLLKDIEDWCEVVDLAHLLSKKTSSDDVFQFVLKNVATKYFGAQNGGFKYSYRIDEKMKRQIIGSGSHCLEILKSLASRLLKTQREARTSGSLQDEPILGCAGQRRFRVTGDERIHYEYLGKQTILFKEYFGPGRHDAGL